jgi:hypothetical protein
MTLAPMARLPQWQLSELAEVTGKVSMATHRQRRACAGVRHKRPHPLAPARLARQRPSQSHQSHRPAAKGWFLVAGR